MIASIETVWWLEGILLALGIIFVTFPQTVRDLYYKSYKEGNDYYDLGTYWLKKFPGVWFFRLFGFIFFVFALAIVFLHFRNQTS